MVLRRVFFRWQQVAVIVLPVWLTVGWAIFTTRGWGFLSLFITVPIVFVVLGLVALIASLRPSARSERAASWMDVVVIGIWHISIIMAGCYGSTGASFAIAACALAVAAVWVVIWQLVADGGRRFRETMAEYERVANGTASVNPTGSGVTNINGNSNDDVIIIHESAPARDI